MKLNTPKAKTQAETTVAGAAAENLSRFPGFTVTRRESGVAKMSQGEKSWEEPEVWATIKNPKGRTVERDIHLNSMLCCLPGGSVRGIEATDEQLLEAVLGDESVFG